MCEKIRKSIIEYANSDKEYGWFEHAGVKYPKRALIWYVFGKCKPFLHMLPKYEAFSHMNMKMFNDNCYHTDVILGAGYSLDESYPKGLWDAIYELEKELDMHYDFTVLANGMSKDDTYFKCAVYTCKKPKKDTWNNTSIYCAKKDKYVKRTIVIPTAGIEYDLPAQYADVIICDVGGPLAHLSTVARETGKLLIRCKDGTKLFKKFSSFYIDLDTCKIVPK